METHDGKLEPDTPPEEQNREEPRSEETPEPHPEPPVPAHSPSGDSGNRSEMEAELESLRELLQKNRREIAVVKTMLYVSVVAILAVMFYVINKTQVLRLQDLGAQLTLSQSQASLNLGVQQKKFEQRLDNLETRLQQIMENAQKSAQVNHPMQLSRMEETVTGLHGSLSLLKTNNPSLLFKMDRVKQNTEEMIEAYKRSLMNSSP